VIDALHTRGDFDLRCLGCGREFAGIGGRCDACGGLVDAKYGGPLSFGAAGPATVRYAGTLPVEDLASYRLPVDPTPLVELESRKGNRVVAKVEGTLPTGSTKDRLAAVALPFMLERGVRRFAFSSTGNTAVAYAHALHAYPELEARLYLASEVDRSGIGPLPPNLTLVVAHGDYAGASAMAREDARRTGFVPEGGFFNVGRREGAKLAYLEALDQMASVGLAPAAMVQAVASGLGIYAAGRAIAEMRRTGRLDLNPRLYCAQQESCAPMALAFAAEQEGQAGRRILRNPHGFAPALLLGDPFAAYDYVSGAVRRSGGSFVTVSDREAATTLRLQPELPVPLGPSAAVGLAAAWKIADRLDLADDEALLVLLTGGPDR
jgi:threonine synthase